MDSLTILGIVLATIIVVLLLPSAPDAWRAIRGRFRDGPEP